MNKRLLFVLLIALLTSQLRSNPVDQGTASKVAGSFAQTAIVSARGSQMTLVAAADAYFVFNVGETGFVIVSADDHFRPIVGYSDEGPFPTENPSPEMMYYLDNLSQGREAALRASIRQDASVAEEWQRLLNGNPMPSRNGERKAFHLVQTKWNQNSPYNKFCPADGGRAYAGCVATAMSQVMNYWKHPSHGYGQHSYTHYQYGLLSANFGETEYDFELMPASISDMSPVENIDAVALFMYHCGIAVDMGYGTDGSGAYSEDVPEAILKYFGYTNCARMVYRDGLALGAFQAMLKNQFDMGWPVYYSGSDVDGQGGHAFVCDGYDDNDLFHFNWGWSGSGDGFYAIDELNVSSYAFNSGQAFIANYVPAEVFVNVAKAPDYFVAAPNGDEGFSVTMTWTNPTATIEGAPIETIDEVVVMRDGVAIQSFENPTPGATMTFVDEAGLPITVNYTVHAVYNGIDGRKAHADGINLGPACHWTVNLKTDQESGWGNGVLTLKNSSGVVLAELSASHSEDSFEVEVPVGRTTFSWEAPADSIQIGMEVLDASGQQVFSYEGPSTLMPQGLFFETVNTCGAENSLENPSDLKAQTVGDDVILQWKGASDPDALYIVYRDGFFYTMVHGATTYTDELAAQKLHSYSISAFSPEGESDPSNIVSAIAETELGAPNDLDVEILDNGKTKLTWTAPEQAEQLVGYYLYRKAKGEEYKRIKTLGPNASEYIDNFNVPDGDLYDYYLIAVYRDRAYLESSPARSLQHPDRHFVEVNKTHLPSYLTLDEQEGNLVLQWEVAMLAETYNVYRNGERVAEGLTETQYACVADGEPAYYQVTGVLNGVESSPSYKAFYANYAVDETDDAQVAIYPNPTNGQTLVQAEGIREVSVYSLTGQQILNCQASGNQTLIDMRGQKPGVYFIKISTDHGELVRKLVLTQSL